MKKILFILKDPPFKGTTAQETLDMAMTAAAFDQHVSLLLLDDGVFLLKQNQQPDSIGLKDIHAILNALPLCDISTIYVEIKSLAERGLSERQLGESFIMLGRTEMGELLNQFDFILAA